MSPRNSAIIDSCYYYCCFIFVTWKRTLLYALLYNLLARQYVQGMTLDHLVDAILKNKTKNDTGPMNEKI